MSSLSSQDPSSSAAAPKVNKDLINRGVYKTNVAGIATFTVLRALDPLLQYKLLKPSGGWGTSLLTKLGISTASFPSSFLVTLGSLTLPLPQAILLAMAVGSSLKQIFWVTYINNEEFTPAISASVSAYNSVVNSLDSLLLLAAGTSAALLAPTYTNGLTLPIAIGASLYAVGITLETVSEIQRKQFKDDEANKGKICTTGFWGLARHINYGGYTLWRTGMCLAGGGWTAGAGMLAWHLWTFLARSTVLMDEYMTDKYKGQWVKYKTDVPYKLFPGIY
ncbi:hypothetical protein B0H63DRAFT_445801 [Podospora didyma]|uniref:Steroid 5-alpha reductase C-terminal domain-containing protein n=1 Tax=Podospora didyma TaxID=330526 RepID=A0AAE0U3V1_9PEZI|nr:hypothetical protein B0H63DRAFT_445801 [Podospora didyma]